MEEIEYHLNQTLKSLSGPTDAQIISNNQWAATALDLYHNNSTAQITFQIDGKSQTLKILWDSDFSKDAMKEKRKMAEEGGVAFAFFVMSVIAGYKHVIQSEIGNGVDYRFKKNKPDEENLNFFDESHYVEVSGILEEKDANTLSRRIGDKHDQIERGSMREKSSSVIVTLFKVPIIVKEIHK
jgi:hypothetical protein